MIHRLAVAAICGVLTIAGVTSVVAQSNPIAERQKLMKEMSQAARGAGAMLKGEAPFDLAKVQATLQTFADVAKKEPSLFPENSKTGNDTEALPKIWADKASFEAHFAKLEKEALAAKASIKDEASFKATFPGVLKNCGGCHQDYRAKKS